MAERLTMVLELHMPSHPLRGGTRRQQLAARQAEVDALERPLLARIDLLRSRDPDLEVLLHRSATAILIIRSTPDVLAELSQAPEVERAYPAPDLELARQG